MSEHKINIQWFPGHMTKAKREMEDKLKLVDLVLELRDARIVESSRNPMLDQLIKDKPRIIILSKKDKAEVEVTKAWIKKLENETTKVIALDILHENITQMIVSHVQQLMKSKIDRMIKRGIRPRAMRAMVVGVPNVGKSTFINRFSKKNLAASANRPGVTRSLQWVKVNKDLELLDTPGVLWPKFEDEQVGLRLAITGAIRDEILPLEDVVLWAIEVLMKDKKEMLESRYGITCGETPYETLLKIGQKRGCLRNGEIDEKRTIEMFLKELRDDKLGRISWEKPNEM